MVGIEYIVSSAIDAWRDMRGAVAGAVLRAVGIRPSDVARGGTRLPRTGSIVSAEAMGEILECFANEGSPMDGRR